MNSHSAVLEEGKTDAPTPTLHGKGACDGVDMVRHVCGTSRKRRLRRQREWDGKIEVMCDVSATS